MKSVKLTALFIAMVCLFLNCTKKGEDEGSDCEDDNTTKVTYRNTGSVPLRVVVATSLTPQFVPISPILTLDLAPGASVVKEIQADRYFNVWYTNCSATCAMASSNTDTYVSCNEYTEELGL